MRGIEHMIEHINSSLTFTQLTTILEKIPVGITIIDRKNRMLFYNEHSSKIVDRKPEYIGKNIESCHQKKQSIDKIEKMLADLDKGRIDTAFYEAERNNRRIAVTVFPFKLDDSTSGFIQVIVAKS